MGPITQSEKFGAKGALNLQGIPWRDLPPWKFIHLFDASFGLGNHKVVGESKHKASPEPDLFAKRWDRTQESSGNWIIWNAWNWIWNFHYSVFRVLPIAMLAFSHQA